MYGFLLVLLLSANLYAVNMVSDYNPPWNGNPNSTHYRGLILEDLQKIFLNIHYEEMSYEKALSDLKSKKADILLKGFEDLEGFERISLPHKIQYCFVTRFDKLWKYNGPPSLKRIKLGVVKGYRYAPKLDEALKSQPVLEEHTGGDAHLRLLQRLKKNKLDVIVIEKHLLEFIEKELPFFTKTRLAGCLPERPFVITVRNDYAHFFHTKETLKP